MFQPALRKGESEEAELGSRVRSVILSGDSIVPAIILHGREITHHVITWGISQHIRQINSDFDDRL